MRTLFQIDASIDVLRKRMIAGDEQAKLLIDILLDERLEVMKHDENTSTQS